MLFIWTQLNKSVDPSEATVGQADLLQENPCSEVSIVPKGLSKVAVVVKKLPANAGDIRGMSLPLVGKTRWRRK